MHILFLTQKAVLMPVIQYSAQKIFQMRNEPCIIYGLLVQLNLKGILNNIRQLTHNDRHFLIQAVPVR